MKNVHETGGARIGWANATWPFASLKATETELILNAAIIGKLIFKPGDIDSIVPYNYIPLIGQGIKINHKVASYKEHVVFWTFRNSAELIREIEQTGFLNAKAHLDLDRSSKTAEIQKTGGFPLKTSFVIAIIVLWNALFLVDARSLFQEGKLLFGFGTGILLSTGTVLLASILLLFSSGFQKIALKEGRDIKDLSKSIYFIILIVGMLFLFNVFIVF